MNGLHMRITALFISTAMLAACSSERFVRLNLYSDPAGAYVSIVESGHDLGVTPEANKPFMQVFEPNESKERQYSFRFRKPGYKDDVVRVTISDWKKTASEAMQTSSYVQVRGVMLECGKDAC